MVRWQMARAERFEAQARPAAALTVYDTLLPLVQAKQAGMRSRIEYQRGESLWQMQRASDAFIAYQRALDLDGGNDSARQRLAELYLAAGSPEKALEMGSEIARRNPDNADALAMIGAALATLGRGGPAVIALSRALEIDPRRTQASLLLAELYNQLDRVDQARAVLYRSAAAAPGSAQPLLGLARLDEQEGNVESAERNYRDAARASDTPETNLRLAQFLERSGRVEEAVALLRKVDAMQPAQPTALADFQLGAGRPDEASLRYGQLLLRGEAAPAGARHCDRGDESPAAAAARQARNAVITRLVEADIAAAAAQMSVATGPRERSALLARARADLENHRSELDAATIGTLQAEIGLAEGNLSEALLRASSAVTLSPESAAAHFVLGEARRRSGDVSSAREEWQAALESDAGYLPAHVALAETALETGNPADAERDAVAAVRQEPGDLRALVVYARVLLSQGRLDAAESVARRGVQVDAKAYEPHLVLGQIALERRKMSGALLEFQRALVLAPQSAETMEALTRFYRTGNLPRPLLLRMEQVADTPPQSATLLEVTGRLFAVGGWHADAERCLRRSLAVEPARGTAARALVETYAARGELEAAAEVASRTSLEAAALVAGLRAQERREYDAAARAYEFALRRGEPSGVAANNLAWIYARQGSNLERALALARNARELAPSSPEVADTLGVVHMARREYSESVAALESAARLLPHAAAAERARVEADVREHLAEAYRAAGRPQDAARVAR